MKIFSRLFQFLSKTDRRVIAQCTDIAVKTQVSFGVFVFLTGCFAFLSCMYAMYMTFNSFNVAIPIALLYSSVIVFIDREIVSAPKKTAALPRILLAIVIGLVISVPLELRLFQARIDQEIDRLNKVENNGAVVQREQEQRAYDDRITTLESEIAEYRRNIAEASQAMHDEITGQVRDGKVRSGKAGLGSAYMAAEEQLNRNQQILNTAQTELDKLKQAQREAQSQIDKNFSLKAMGKVEDLLSRYEALELVKAQSSAAWSIAWGLRLLIIMLEVIPALMKLLQQSNEYNVILEALRRMNITRIYAIANDHIDQIVQSPHTMPTPTLLEQLENNPLTR